MSPIATVFTIIFVVVVLFVWDRLPVVVVALGTAVALFLTGILDLPKAFAGFGDPTVLFIASLFVVSAGLEATGVTAWAGQLLSHWAGTSRARLLTLIMVMVAVVAAMININGAVPALLPVVVVLSVRLGHAPSQLLMPLAFAASAGSLLALTGTPVNVIASDTAVAAGAAPFGYFEFALVGVPALAGTIAITVFFGRWLLPDRRGDTLPADLSRHARTLIEHYRLTGELFQVRVRAGSPVIGESANALNWAEYPGVSLVSAHAANGTPLVRPIAEDDHLVIRGDADAVARLAADQHLAFRAEDKSGDSSDTLFNRESGLAEIVIPPRSPLIGTEMFPGMVTPSGDLVVLAVQRGDQDLTGKDWTLEAGDTILLRGTWRALDKHLADPDVLVVDSPEIVRRQAVPLGPGSVQAIAVLAALVVCLATGWLPAAVAGVIAACALVAVGVLSVDQAYKAVNWTTVILIGAMTPLSTAMRETGAAEMLANTLVRAVESAGPHALLAGLFLLTGVLGQLISNTATALIVFPIAVVAAQQLGISPRAVVMSVNVAAAASFLTPVATPVNLIVMGPGGYRFTDYWKLGLPIMAWFFVIAVIYVPLVWPLRP